jgi:hypothetical protein
MRLPHRVYAAQHTSAEHMTPSMRSQATAARRTAVSLEPCWCRHECSVVVSMDPGEYAVGCSQVSDAMVHNGLFNGSHWASSTGSGANLTMRLF